MRYMNITPVKERRMNFEDSVDGQTVFSFLWVILMVSFSAFLIFVTW